MADKDIQIQARNDSNTETDNLYPITKVDNVQGLSTELSNINTNILTRQADWGATTVHRDRIDATISSRQANWGATTTHRDRINATISSRADQTTANAIKAKTDLIGVANPTANTTTVMGYLRKINDDVANNGGIKLVQRGTTTVTVNSSSTDVNVNISPVNMSKAFVNMNYNITIGNSYPERIRFGLSLINSTTIRIHLVSNIVLGNIGIPWEVIEYN